MKKFRTFLLIIIVLGIFGGGFYLGWIQFQLDENEYAVVFTKITGYHKEVLEPGNFVWMWQRLVPTNMKLHVFRLDPRSSTLSVSGTLPSGEVYSNYLEGTPSFEYSFSFNMTYRLKAEHLPELAEGGFLTPGNLDTWYTQFEENCLVKAVSFLNEKASNSDLYDFNSGNLVEIESLLKEYLSSYFPHIDFINIIPSKLKIPDAELYQLAKDEYFSLMDAKHTMNLEALKEATDRTMNQTANLELLGEYGKLLTTYPILIEYLDKNPVLSDELILSLQGE